MRVRINARANQAHEGSVLGYHAMESPPGDLGIHRVIAGLRGSGTGNVTILPLPVHRSEVGCMSPPIAPIAAALCPWVLMTRIGHFLRENSIDIEFGLTLPLSVVWLFTGAFSPK